MLLKRVRCGNCGRSFSLGPGILEFKPAPYVLECEECHIKVPSNFSYRYTYYFYYCWKLCVIFSGVFFALNFMEQDDKRVFFMLPFAIMIIGGGGGFVASYFLALPFMLIADLFKLLSGIGHVFKKSSTVYISSQDIKLSDEEQELAELLDQDSDEEEKKEEDRTREE